MDKEKKLRKETPNELIINSLCCSLQQLLEKHQKNAAEDYKDGGKYVPYDTLQEHLGYALLLAFGFDTVLDRLEKFDKDADIRKWIDQDIMIKNLASLNKYTNDIYMALIGNNMLKDSIKEDIPKDIN